MTRRMSLKLTSNLAVALVVIRLCLGIVFIWSSVAKILNSYAFFVNIGGYDLVAPKFAVWIAMVLPWVELVVGICLICNVALLASLVVSATMLAIFSVATASVLVRGISVVCGCFGDTELVGPTTLARAAGFGVLSCAGIWLLLRATLMPSDATVGKETVPTESVAKVIS